MHIADIFLILYIAVWIVMGLTILRESRFQSGLVRMLAIGAVVLGPFGMFAYLAIRFLGHNLREGYWVGRLREAADGRQRLPS